MSSQAPRKSIAMAETDYFKKISIKEFTQNKIAEAARNSIVSPMRGSVTGKQPRQGPYGAKPTMCNERLEMHSETMNDDNQVPVAKRCILLLGGENDDEEVPLDNAHP